MKKLCEVHALTPESDRFFKTLQQPMIGDICSNKVHPFFIWTKEHKYHTPDGRSVMNSLPEYKDTKVKHLYITSDHTEREPIQPGDYLIWKGMLYRHHKESFTGVPWHECKRVIATTNTAIEVPLAIPPSFIEQFIEAEGKIEKVLVDYHIGAYCSCWIPEKEWKPCGIRDDKPTQCHLKVDINAPKRYRRGKGGMMTPYEIRISPARWYDHNDLMNMYFDILKDGINMEDYQAYIEETFR